MPSSITCNERVRQWSTSQPSLEITDEELIARLQADDSNALEPLFRRFSKRVFSVALRILHDRGEAEEVVQEVFFSLFRRAKLFDSSRGSAKAWISQVASHRALDRKAYLSRRGFYVSTDIAQLADALSKEADQDRRVGEHHDLIKIERALGQLSHMQQYTLGLYYFEGLDLYEIAERLHQSLGNTRHHLYRGVEHLRRNASVRRLRESRPGLESLH